MNVQGFYQKVVFSFLLVYFFFPTGVSWTLVTCSICVLSQRVRPDLTRCHPGSRNVFPVQPTVWQKRTDLWCVCVRRTTSEHPWTPPQHPAQVIQLFNVVQSLMSCLNSAAFPGLFYLLHRAADLWVHSHTHKLLLYGCRLSSKTLTSRQYTTVKYHRE